MLDSLLKTLGSGFIMPAVFVILAGWAVKVLLDVSTSSRQSRKDFLDSWGKIDHADDLALEVGVRHLIGTYLPAPLLRRALGRAYPSRTFVRLSALWDLLEFDADTRRLYVAKRMCSTPRRARITQVLHLLGYAAACLVSFLFGKWAMAGAPTHLMPWLYAFLAITSLVLAVASLERANTLGLLAREGFTLLDALNDVPAREMSLPSDCLQQELGAVGAASADQAGAHGLVARPGSRA